MTEVTVREIGRSAWLTEMFSIQSYEPLKTEKFLWPLSEMQRMFSSRTIARYEQKNGGRRGKVAENPGIL